MIKISVLGNAIKESAADFCEKMKYEVKHNEMKCEIFHLTVNKGTGLEQQ